MCKSLQTTSMDIFILAPQDISKYFVVPVFMPFPMYKYYNSRCMQLLRNTSQVHHNYILNKLKLFFFPQDQESK